MSCQDKSIYSEFQAMARCQTWHSQDSAQIGAGAIPHKLMPYFMVLEFDPAMINPEGTNSMALYIWILSQAYG